MSSIAYHDTCPFALEETLLGFDAPEDVLWYRPHTIREIHFSHPVFSGTGRILAASHAVSIQVRSLSMAHLVTCVPIPGLSGIPLLSRRFTEESGTDHGLWKGLSWQSSYKRLPLALASLPPINYDAHCTQLFPGDGNPFTQLGIETLPERIRVYALHTYPNRECAVLTLLELGLAD